MPEITAFFRHCPACGRRFHIRLVSKELTTGETIKEKLTPSEGAMDSALVPTPFVFATPLAEGPSVIVDVENFRYTYKCTHCGHEWTEKREKEFTEKI